MSISDPLAQVLAAGRAQFNARVVDAKHRYPTLDTAAFAVFLQTSVDAVVRAVAPIAPDRVASVVVVAYDMGLELVAQSLAGPGARNNLIDRVWQTLAPQCASLLAEQPADLLGTLSNAAVTLGKVPNARTEEWLSGMVKLSVYAHSLFYLRSLGQIMAWRAGLAHFRSGALHVADQLPEDIALAAVGADSKDNWATVRARFMTNPWWSPESKKLLESQTGKTFIEVGQFTGFGGSFSVPPEIRATSEGFCVKSADQYTLLIADVYGAVLVPAMVEEFTQFAQRPAANSPAIKGSTIILDRREIVLDLPEEGLTLAWNEHTVAVSSPYTFSIRLFPRQ